MICVSISDCSVQDCLAAVGKEKFAEVRLETISGLKQEDVREIFSRKAKLIATCRPGSMKEEERKKLLLAAIEAGAAYVDVEVDAADDYKREIVPKARAKGCKVIVSFHDYDKTPLREELQQIVKWCFESGADIAKIACKANSEKDCARLLGLLDCEGKLIAIGMGDKGRITRVVAPLLGSPFTYASVSDGKETAKGQMTAEKTRKLMEEVRHA